MAIDTGYLLENRYEVTRAIRTGGMGAVYEARDRRLANTPCAVKEILEHRLSGSDASYLKARFEQEMAALATLDHPGIPRVRDYFPLGSSFYIVMDYIDGQSLDTELAESLQVTGRPLEPEVVAATALQVLEILAYLHGHKPPLVHRDVKPSNLIRESKSGRIKLVDFGLAKAVDHKSQTMVGTPGFCAVEQMSGKAEPRSDLYSLGATMHQLLTGQLPRMLNLAPLREAMADYRPELAAIVDRATAHHASDRYPDAAAMMSDLRGWLQNSGPCNGAASSPIVLLSPGTPYPANSQSRHESPLAYAPAVEVVTAPPTPGQLHSAPPAWFFGAVAAATVMVGLLLGQIFASRPGAQAAAPTPLETAAPVVLRTPPPPKPVETVYPKSPDYIGDTRAVPRKTPPPTHQRLDPPRRVAPRRVTRPELAEAPAYPVAARIASRRAAPAPTPEVPQVEVAAAAPLPPVQPTFERRPLEDSLGRVPGDYRRQDHGGDVGFHSPDGLAVGARAYFFAGTPDEARQQVQQNWKEMVWFGSFAQPCGNWLPHDGQMCLGVNLGGQCQGFVNVKFRPASGGTRVLVLGMKNERGTMDQPRAAQVAGAFDIR